ncbi:MAG: toxin-antitoxin system protein [Gemmatimonadetes bacterium]|nr:toxin-antitoxin system protein [Gemmatimonadota bacterium]
MGKERLHLSVERVAIERGRRYSELHRTSISKLVHDFLSSLPVDEDGRRARLTPAVRRLLGVAAGGADVEDYRRHLLEKYGS